MIKIRIWGSEKEIEQVVKSINEKNTDLRIIEESKNYKDRKPSDLYRKYISLDVVN